jgi:hypothetical protein
VNFKDFLDKPIILEDDGSAFTKKVMQACNNLDDDTKQALAAALQYAASAAKNTDSDFVKSFGAKTAGTILGQAATE